MTVPPPRRIAWLAVCAVPFSAAAQPSVPPPASVVVDAARVQSLEQWREVTGELRPARRALLAAEEEGLVVEVVPREGDTVSAGQVIARLHDTRARMDVERARADLAARRATVAEREADAVKARRDVDRVEELFARASATASEREDRRSALAAAEARLAHAHAEVGAAEAELALAERTLQDMSILAPFGARVISRRTEVGQWLRRGEPVVEIVDLSWVEAWLDVPERLVVHLSRPGVNVQVRITALGETRQAPIASLIPDADPRSRLFPVRIRLDNADLRLSPGMSIVGLAPSGTPAPTLTIHKDALRRDDAGEFVYFESGGLAAVARVETLFGAGDRVAVRAPALGDGTPIVVEGNERLYPLQPLQSTPRTVGGR